MHGFARGTGHSLRICPGCAAWIMSAASGWPRTGSGCVSQRAAKRKLRVGAVSYLNTKPLIYSFADFARGAELILDLPSRLADRLADGDLDVALIPSVEALQHPGYTIVSDACIACRGPVLSVKLFCRVPLPEIRTLALDEGSRTSAAMVQVLLWDEYGIRPQTTSLLIGDSLEGAATDAVLLIGDRAIHARSPQFPYEIDLGEWWCRHTGLPFVFAMWTARPGWDQLDIALALSHARDAGVASVESIARAEAGKVGLSQSECQGYLQDNLHFYLREPERLGLTRFYEEAASLDLVPCDRELRFYDCTIT